MMPSIANALDSKDEEIQTIAIQAVIRSWKFHGSSLGSAVDITFRLQRILSFSGIVARTEAFVALETLSTDLHGHSEVLHSLLMLAIVHLHSHSESMQTAVGSCLRQILLSLGSKSISQQDLNVRLNELLIFALCGGNRRHAGQTIQKLCRNFLSRDLETILQFTISEILIQWCHHVCTNFKNLSMNAGARSVILDLLEDGSPSVRGRAAQAIALVV